MKNIKIVSLLLIVGFIPSLLAFSYVEKKREERGNTFSKIQRRSVEGRKMAAQFLKLSEEQKEKMKQIKFTQMKNSVSVKNELNEKQARLKTLSTGNNVDLKAIDKVLQEIQALKTTLAKHALAGKFEMRQVLTTEQVIILDAKRSGDSFQGKQVHRGRNAQANNAASQKRPGMMPDRSGNEKPPMDAGMNRQRPGRASEEFHTPSGMRMRSQQMRAGDRERTAGKMDFTDAQKEQLKNMKLEQMKVTTDFKNQLNEWQAKLKIATSGDKPSQKEAEKILDEMGKIQLEMAKAKVRNEQTFRGLLNDEQKVWFDVKRASSHGMIKPLSEVGRRG